MNTFSTALVVTSISSPNHILTSLAEGAQSRGIPFYVIGDVRSPMDFSLPGCDFYSLTRQAALDFKTPSQCPTRHYARKNIGYLLAASAGCEVIVETDDDNVPRDSFWSKRTRSQSIPRVESAGWVNGYEYFCEGRIWPRGLPLDAIQQPAPSYSALKTAESDCPIQQGLADENPDVDAIYRLILPLPINFRNDRRVAFAKGSWCPFNSQNTTWWADAFPLLYLPAYCSFRMTDIWRSFIAQRIAWENDWAVLFTEPTVWQERNDHDLMKDFSDEVSGYLHNRQICQVLEDLSLKPGTEQIPDNMRVSYEALVKLGVISDLELPLLDAWLADLQSAMTPKARRNSASH